jgi:hypothetical protein
MAKVIIYMRDHELTALTDLAQREYRAPKAQAALIIRRELEKLGMIPGEQPAQSNQTTPPFNIQGNPAVEGG